jgi:uncharacterized protein (DUF2141 family)
MKVDMQKAITLMLCLFYLIKYADAQNKINVRVTNFRSDKGITRLCLFNSEASFAGNGAAYKCMYAPINKSSAVITFENIPPGTYAIAVFHDANQNGKIDKNFLGIPKEGYGASGNKLPFASAPTFKDNQFIMGNNTTLHLTIRLRNL